MIDYGTITDMNLVFLQHDRHGDHNGELLCIPLVIIRHGNHRAVLVTDEHHLGGLVEEIRIGLRDIETAKRHCRSCKKQLHNE